ncbi:hypothetical protein TWF718_005308 [Orbilia javanica]|uniref:Peptidase S8/S53 domain-containing protein n=1 Tax=Orbilia javanica TaxID=47235 RepID=A0AAN8NWP7_9PEZI
MPSLQILRAATTILIAITITGRTVLSEVPVSPFLPKIGTVEHRQEHWMIIFTTQAVQEDPEVSWSEAYKRILMPHLLPPKNKSFDIHTDSRTRTGWFFVSLFKGDRDLRADLRELSAPFAEKISSYSRVYSSVAENFKASPTSPWLATSLKTNWKREIKKPSLLSAAPEMEQPIPTSTLPVAYHDVNAGLQLGNGTENLKRRRKKKKRANLVKVRKNLKAPREMQVISRPPSIKTDLQSLPQVGDYYFYSTGGSRQVIYVVDSGADTLHPQLANARIQDWIFPGTFPIDEKSDNLEYHGTKVLSKIVGKGIGTAPDAEIVMVASRDGRGIGTNGHFLYTFLEIRRHIETYNSHKNCIINISSTWPNVTEYAKRFFLLFMNWAKRKNVILVMAAGNEKPGTPITGYPAAILNEKKYEEQYWKRFVVVGGFDMSGKRNLVQQSAPYVKVSAPSWQILAAAPFADPYVGYGVAYHPPTKSGLRKTSGTSYSTPTVSGMIATWISAGVFTIDNVVEGMYELAYNRTLDGPKVLYNGIKPSQWPKGAKAT